MKHIDPRNLHTAFVCPGTPMFSDLIESIKSDLNLPKSRRRDLISALRRAATALAQDADRVPADPKWLQPRLARVVPAALGLMPKSWSNILSDVRTAMARAGITTPRNNQRDHLDPDWGALWDQVLMTDDLTLRRSLCRFVYFLNGQGVRPDKVDSADAEAFREALALNEISRSPQRAYENALGAWNLAVERVTVWPRQRLSRPSRRIVVQLPLEQFTQAFRGDLDRYLSGLAKPDPFDPDGRFEALSPGTVDLYRQRLLRFASILVRSGHPIGEICGLADLVVPETTERGLRAMLERNDDKSSVSIAETATLLKGIGRRYVHVPDPDQTRLGHLAKRVAIKSQQGLTQKNRERLRQFDDQDMLRMLLQLPDKLFEQADCLGQQRRAFLMREQAVAIAILLYCPVRVKNLASIHLQRSVQRPRDGRTFLVFAPDEVKNARAIEFELPRSVAALIEQHVATRSPGLCPPSTPWLFPRRAGEEHMDPKQLSRALFRTIRTATGLEINVHLFRHLAAKLWLEAHPGAYEAVRRLLGHSRLSRTLNAYAGFEAGTATRAFAEIIDAGRAT